MPADLDALISEADDKALAEFTEYFVRNYPGPDTIIGDPRWHAPRIFRAARRAIIAALRQRPGREEVERRLGKLLTAPRYELDGLIEAFLADLGLGAGTK